MRWLLVGALLLGLMAAGITYSYFRQAATQQAVSRARPATIPVVVAVENIPARATITDKMVALREVPPELVTSGAARTLDSVTGRVAKENILAGEPVAEARLFPKGVKPGLSFAIPAGRRALTVGVNEVIGVAGFVKPGDRVDILGTYKAGSSPGGAEEYRSEPVVEDVPVLAVAQEASEKDAKEDAKVVTSVTLAVTTEQARRIAQAEEKGVLRLLLRPYVSPGTAPVVAKTENTARPATKPSTPIVTMRPKPTRMVVPAASTASRPSSSTAAPAVAKPEPSPEAAPSPVATAVPAPSSVPSQAAPMVAAAAPPAPPAPAPARVVVEVIRGTERSTVTVESQAEAKEAPGQ